MSPCASPRDASSLPRRPSSTARASEVPILGATIARNPGVTAASRSRTARSGSALILTRTSIEPDRDVIVAARPSRAVDLRSAGTLSSRSRMTASAPDRGAAATNFGVWAGTKSKERQVSGPAMTYLLGQRRIGAHSQPSRRLAPEIRRLAEITAAQTQRFVCEGGAGRAELKGAYRAPGSPCGQLQQKDGRIGPLHDEAGIVLDRFGIWTVVMDPVPVEGQGGKSEQGYRIDSAFGTPVRLLCDRRGAGGRRVRCGGHGAIDQRLLFADPQPSFLLQVMLENHEHHPAGRTGLGGDGGDPAGFLRQNAERQRLEHLETPGRPHPPLKRDRWQEAAATGVAVGAGGGWPGSLEKIEPLPSGGQGVALLRRSVAPEQGAQGDSREGRDEVEPFGGSPDPFGIIDPAHAGFRWSRDRPR